MNAFIEQIQEIQKLETNNCELYQFCVNACDEIFKYTGNHEWHDKLHKIVRKNSAHDS